ncbi:hypothetical protein QG37_06620 [Candidozyma auris]|nr:hypothetical protein QG37_06620 [[Candida] auris]
MKEEKKRKKKKKLKSWGRKIGKAKYPEAPILAYTSHKIRRCVAYRKNIHWVSALPIESMVASSPSK